MKLKKFRKHAIFSGTGGINDCCFGVSKYLAEKGHTVIMTARDLKSLELKKSELQSSNSSIHCLQLDVSDSNSIQSGVKKILGDFKRVDILVNNAGIFRDGLNESAEKMSQSMLQSFQTNTIGPALLIQSLLPEMKKNNYGRIVNVSSGMAGLSEMQGGSLAYRTSKAALNAVTRRWTYWRFLSRRKISRLVRRFFTSLT